MLNKFQIGKYYPTDSIVHSINPTCKILCVFLIVATLFVSSNILFDVLVLFIIIFLTFLSRIPSRLYLNFIMKLKYFYLSIFLLNIVCNESFVSSFQMIIKICIMVLYSQILVLTTSLHDMMFGINKLLYPFKIFGIKTKQLTFCLSLAISFIPIILSQTESIMKALASRGIDYKKSSIRQKLYIMRAIILPIFILTLRKADYLAESLEVRQYNIHSNYFENRKNRWNRIDILMLLIHIFIFLILGVIL